MPFGGVVLLFIIVFGTLYFYFQRKYNYWKARGVPCRKPIFPFGNILDVAFYNDNLALYFADLYNKFDAPFIGFYAFLTPHLLLRDLDLIKTVLVKEFNIFANKSFFIDEKIDPILSNSLVAINVPHWNKLRKKLSPVFTSGRIKIMTPLMLECGKSLEIYITSMLNQNIDMKDIAAKYTTDVITSCAFGFNANSFVKKNPFWCYGQLLFPDSLLHDLKSMTFMFAHILVKIFQYTFFDKRSTTFFKNIFVTTLETRELNQIKRNDLVDILIQIKNSETCNDNFKLEGDRIFAQAIVFFAAGHETTSSTIAFTLHELSVNPDIQERLINEILAVIDSYGKITYEAVQEMKYLDMVVSETLRKYSTTPVLNRVALKDYKDSKTGLIIEKGMSVLISQPALHLDPQYFPNPEKYDPERFCEDNKQKIPNYAYIPFGDGPRNCIGKRFALLSSKLGVINVLKKFRVHPNTKTRHPLVFNRSTFLKSKYGIPLTCRKL